MPDKNNLDQVKLYSLMENLKSRGFKHFSLEKDWWKDDDNLNTAMKINAYFPLIYSDEFAKFIWGEQLIDVSGIRVPKYIHHLSRMAISKNKLDYINSTTII